MKTKLHDIFLKRKNYAKLLVKTMLFKFFHYQHVGYVHNLPMANALNSIFTFAQKTSV